VVRHVGAARSWAPTPVAAVGRRGRSRAQPNAAAPGPAGRRRPGTARGSRAAGGGGGEEEATTWRPRPRPHRPRRCRSG
jgi:hypothetical protein